MRRTVAIALTILLANVNVARALACETAPSRPAPAAGEHHHQGNHEEHVPAPDTQDESVPAPCCQGMTSCVVAAAPTPEQAIEGVAIASASIHRAAFETPPSLASTPEPPPPRR